MTQWCRLHGAIACPLCFPRPTELMLMEDEHLQRQITEDTCAEHGAFCCPLCFGLPYTGDDVDWSAPVIETDDEWEIVKPTRPLCEPTKAEEWALWYCDMLDELACFLASIGLKSWAMRVGRRIDRIALPITERRMQ